MTYRMPRHQFCICNYLRKSLGVIVFAAGALMRDQGIRAEDLAASLSDIAAAIQQQEKELKSLYVQYESASKLVGKAADAHTYLGTEIVYRDNVEYALKGRKRYYSMRKTDNLADVSVKVESIVHPGTSLTLLANRITAFDGTTLQKRNAGGQTASVGVGLRDGDDSGFFDHEYLRAAFKSPPDVIFPSNDRESNRLDGVIKAGLCTLRTEKEAVDGESCIVIDVTGPTHRTVWCDPQLGFAVRKLLGRSGTSSAVSWMTTSNDFVEVTRGVWLPKKVHTNRYAGSDAPLQLQDQPLVAYDLEVKNIHANDVDDSLFTLSIPPGTIVNDYSQGKEDDTQKVLALTYKMPANGESLDKTIADLKNKREGSMPTPRGKSRDFLFYGNLFVVIAVGGYFIYHRFLSK